MLKNLFSSELRISLLNQFLMHPEREFYLRQLSGLFHASPRSVSLELQNLAGIELVKKRESGHQHFYSVNKQHILFADLRSIFIKTKGLRDMLKEKIQAFAAQIEFAFIYGSIARQTSTSASDVDLLIIGNTSTRLLSEALLDAGEILQREINFSQFTLDDVKSRLKNTDHFITGVFNEPKIMLIGELDELERLAK